MRNQLIVSAAVFALAACTSRPATNAVVEQPTVAAGDAMVAPDGSVAVASNGTAPQALPVATSAFTATAAMSDMYEIAAGRIAATKATDPSVKKFGQQMVEAHTATTAALKQAATKDSVALTPPPTLDDKHQGLIDALNSADAATFDEVYKSQQRDAHQEALALMQSYASSGDKPAIRAFAAETAPKVQMHLGMLNQMN